jgi:hypothetical protein
MDITIIILDALVLIAVGMNTALNWYTYFNKDK